MIKNIKVILLTSSISRAAGGLFDAIKDLYMILNKDIDLIIYSYSDEFTTRDLHQWNGLKIKLYKNENFFQYSSQLRSDIVEEDADLLHVHGLWRFPHAVIPYWKKKTGKPVIVTPHGMLDPYILKNQGTIKRMLGNLLFANKAFQNIDHFQALSQKEYEDIRAYGLNQPIVMIPNGINLPTPNHKMPRKDPRKSLLFLGRLHPKKGIDILIEALANIKEDNEDLLKGWVVDVVGWSQENFDEKLKALVKMYQLEDFVVFHGGLFDEQKKEMYHQATGYILPSYGEGLPMTVLEAWAYRLPVLITAHCNLPEGFEHKAALEIETNKGNIASQLVAFFSMSQSQRESMGERGYQLVENHFTWQSSADKMLALYKTIISQNTKPEFVYE